jgi:hypothetical protein
MPDASGAGSLTRDAGRTHDVIDIYPIILIFVVMLVWVFTVRQNGKLVKAFWERLPKVAAQELPGTLDLHPEKFIFFFRRRAADVLREDQVLWKMRQLLVLWVVLSLLTPVLGMLPLLILAVLSWR